MKKIKKTKEQWINHFKKFRSEQEANDKINEITQFNGKLNPEADNEQEIKIRFYKRVESVACFDLWVNKYIWDIYCGSQEGEYATDDCGDISDSGVRIFKKILDLHYDLNMQELSSDYNSYCIEGVEENPDYSDFTEKQLEEIKKGYD